MMGDRESFSALFLSEMGIVDRTTFPLQSETLCFKKMKRAGHELRDL